MNFAKRAQWNTRINALTLLKSQLEEQGVDYIDATNTNPTQCEFEFLNHESYGLLKDNQCSVYEANPKGYRKTRVDISKYYASLGQAVDPDDIILTSGTSEAYSYIFRLLCNPGDSILSPAPSYPLLDYLANLNDIRIQEYSLILKDKKWGLSLDAQAIAANKAFVMIQPGNPTGHVFSEEDFDIIESHCGKADSALIMDEVFGAYTPNFITLAQPKSQVLTFRLNGISKLLALPQMKLSWIIVSGNQKQQALRKLEVISDTYLSVNAPVQQNLRHWLRNRRIIHQEINQRLINNFRSLEKICQNRMLRCYDYQGGWQAMIELPEDCCDEETAIRLLRDHRPLIVYRGPHGGLRLPTRFRDKAAALQTVLQYLPECLV